MKKVVTITYLWECEMLPNIPVNISEILDKEAHERITSTLQQGFTEGELHSYIHVEIPDKTTPEEGWYCEGYFTVQVDVIN